jgi:hypothetical protein
MAYTIHLRADPAPDDAIVMLRAGERGLVPAKLASDAKRSARATGILGISVVATLPGETLEQAWDRSPVTAGRTVVWWSTAGQLRESGFALLATGHNPRHYTAVIEVDFHLMADVEHTYGLLDEISPPSPVSLGQRLLATDGEVTHWARIDEIDEERGTLLLSVLWNERVPTA